MKRNKKIVGNQKNNKKTNFDSDDLKHFKFYMTKKKNATRRMKQQKCFVK